MYYEQPVRVKWYVLYNQSLILLSPVLIGYGFIFESFDNTGIDRSIGTLGVILVFAWLFNICIGRIYQLLKYSKANQPTR